MSGGNVLEKDKEVDWELFISRHREYSPQFAYLVTISQYPKEFLLKNIGVDFEYDFFKRVGNDFYWSKKEYTKLRKMLYLMGKEDPYILSEIIKRAEKNCNNLVTWCKNNRNLSYNSHSNKELIKLLKNHWDYLRKAACFLQVKHNLNVVLEKLIVQKIKKVLDCDDKIANSYFSNILNPSKDTLTTQAYKKLNVFSKKNVSDDKIVDWLKEFDWIETYTWIGNVLTSDDVRKKIIAGIKINRRKKYEFDLVIKKFGNNINLIVLIKSLQNLLYLHTYQFECLLASHYWCKNLIKEIGSRIDLSFEEYPYAILPEVFSGLQGKKIDKKKILLRRGNKYGLYRFKDKIYTIQGEEYKKILLLDKKQHVVRNAIKGNSASLGKVRGVVKIINSVNDFNDYQNEEILVTPMTTIDYTPFLHKVKAIVTNEGGITCHAAIIAREMNKPCVIGAKIATQVFKDGDLVEVDADNGIVRKI